ncbi:hypothetical protein ACUXKL_001001 [Kocuria marina]
MARITLIPFNGTAGRIYDAGHDIAAAGTRLPVASRAEVFPAKITHKGLSKCPQGAGDPVAGNP